MSLEDYIPAPLGQLYFIFFVDLGNVLANELARIFPYKGGYLKEFMSSPMWTWSKFQYYTPEENHVQDFGKIYS